jgi:DNA-3-methyladenine glycosylase II
MTHPTPGSQAAYTHFQRVAPELIAVWDQLDLTTRPLAVVPRHPEVFFSDLADSIVGQQLSGKAAQTIWGRVVALLPNQAVTPENMLALADEQLRAAGLSRAKTSYVKNIATAVLDNQLVLASLPELDNEAVISELTKIKGIGRWTAEMFLMFTLGREDVYSHGDLGLRNGLQKLFPDQAGDQAAAKELIAQWAPYRTYAAKLLWRSLEL